MPCDGRNFNCTRRKELLNQLKCIISAMDKKKPCEWDEPPCPPVVKCFGDAPSQDSPSCRTPAKKAKSVFLRGSMLHRCECIKRNGLQDRCMMLDCMGRPECMTKLYPKCQPGRAALLKLTDVGDTKIALEKFLAADKARESALAAYCRLVCSKPDNNNNDANNCPSSMFTNPPSSSTPRNSPRIQLMSQKINSHDQDYRTPRPPIVTAPCPPQIQHNQPFYAPRQEYQQQPMGYYPNHAPQQHFYPQQFAHPTPFVNPQQTYQLNQQYHY